jgi:hypothetical protein
VKGQQTPGSGDAAALTVVMVTMASPPGGPALSWRQHNFT